MENTKIPQEFQKNKGINVSSVKTPLKFFAFVVLAIESILAITAYSATGEHRTYLILGMIAALLLVILTVALLAFKRPELLGMEVGSSSFTQTMPESNGNLGYTIFRDNDDPDFLHLFQRLFEQADRIHLVGTGFNVMQRDAFRLLLNRRIEKNRELKIYAANPFSPNVQVRLIEEEGGKPTPRMGHLGLITWLRDLLSIHGSSTHQSNFTLKLFPFYPTYAMFIFDEKDYLFYPYGYAQLGTLSPILHFSKKNTGHRYMVEFLDKQYKFIEDCSSDAATVCKIRGGKLVESKSLTAFAIYLIPPANSELYQFGSEVLGYDVRAAKTLNTNNTWDNSIGAAAEFGFHVTVADALYCTHPKDVDLICSEIQFLAKQTQPITLKLHLEKDFPNEQGIALTCSDENGALESMHHEMVARVYPKAVASNYSDSLDRIARPDRDPNKKRARFMIEKYHAPYILQSYKPHFTLLSNVQEDKKEQIYKEITNLFKEHRVESEIQIYDIAVMHRPEQSKHWQILREYRLGGA